jgi:hypothetical protein
LQHPAGDDLPTLKYLLWGDERRRYRCMSPGAAGAFAPPDLIIQVVDASQPAGHLELTLEL